jgi:diacylglycerol kinase (ATP)
MEAHAVTPVEHGQILSKSRVAAGKLAMPVKFLINPIAGTAASPSLWAALRAACTRLGYVAGEDYSLEWTDPGRTVEQAHRAAAMWDRVVAVGGDGTVQQVAEGLVTAGTGAALGVIPQGTANDFSRAVGMYDLWRRRRALGIERLIEWLVTAPTHSVDVLTANDRVYFMSYGSVGFDAQVSRAYAQIRQHPKLRAVLRGRVLNECAYAMLALRQSRIWLPELRLRLDTAETGWTEEHIDHAMRALILSNVSSYAGGVQLAEGACHDDGQFEVTMIPHLRLFALLMASRHWPRLRRACQLPTWRVRGVRLALARRWAIQFDGEDCTERLAGDADAAVHIRVAGQIPVVCGPQRAH